MEKNIRQATKAGSSAGYFISGAAIGAVLGVLFAPKAGRETQKQLGHWIKERREKGRDGYQAMKDALKRGRKNFGRGVKELSDV